MKLSIQAISDFKTIYKNFFGVDLTDDEANQKGLDLLELFQHIFKQVPEKDLPLFKILNQ